MSQTLAIEAVSYSYRASKRQGDGKTVNAFVSFQLSDASDPDYSTGVQDDGDVADVSAAWLAAFE